MGRLEDDYGDVTDSDVPVTSARYRRVRTWPANREDIYQAHPEASADDSEDGDGLDDRSSSSETGWTEEEDVWSTFCQDLQGIETDSNIRRLYPSSLHTDWSPPAQICDEYEVLERMLASDARKSGITFPTTHHDEDYQDSQEYHEFALCDFVIYESVDKKNRLRGHMQSLHIVATEQKSKDFFFDGYVEHEANRQYLQRVPILFVNIGALQDPEYHTTKDDIFIQSDIANRLGNEVGESIWYRLGQPMQEYAELFNDFIWVSDLMKHFVDFLTARTRAHEDIYLEDFRANFIKKLYTWHVDDPTFMKWHTACGSTTDFRRHVNRHAAFLRDQVWSIKGAASLRSSSIWWAIYPGNDFPSRVGPQNAEEQTLVTYRVMRAFQAAFPAWGPQLHGLLKAVEPTIRVEKVRHLRMRDLGFPDKLSRGGHYHNARGVALTDETLEKVGCVGPQPLFTAKDVVGKVIVLRRNELDEAHPKFECSFAYVRTAMIHKGQHSLFIVWVASPRFTMCKAQNIKYGDAQYGVGNELFFSDECCCKPVLLSNVMGVFGVSLFSDHAEANATFFIREKYYESEKCFVTAKITDLRCLCRNNISADQCSSKSSPPPESDASQGGRHSQYPKLKGLSLFSGCGLLDRGLEDSQMIKIVCSIDIDECAVQTSLENQAEPKGEHLTESVNYVFELWRRDRKKQPVIDLIAAGNPCPPFSKLNRHKGNARSQRMCSLLASVLSYVEHFLPRYVLIENVPEMDTMSPACAQAICCLVEMGYQVRKVFLTASACGAPQLRERLFVIAASPGLLLPRHPLDLLPDKPLLTVSQAIRALPRLGNDTIINLTHPDHIPLKRLLPEFGKVNLRALITKVPKPPALGNLFETFRLGRLDHRETRWLLSLHKAKRQKGTKAFGRINPDGPFPAIVTTVNPLDIMSGPFLHFDQDRVMSLHEVMIAQGAADDVIIGSLAKQLRQTGNAVARPVGFAIGLSLGESWYAGIDAGLVSQSTGSPADNHRDPEEDEEERAPARDGVSLCAINEDTPSHSCPLCQDENSQDAMTPALKVPVITIEDSDSNSEPHSRTSRKRPSSSTALSAQDQPGDQLVKELRATQPGRSPSSSPTLSPAQSLAIRRKRIRTILDSEDDDLLAPEQNALSYAAARAHNQSSRATKSARTVDDTLQSFGHTVDDPLVLSD